MPVKPGIWTPSQSMSAHPRLWEGLVFAAPIWETGATTLTNIVTGVRNNAGDTPVWGLGPYGPQINLASGENGAADWPAGEGRFIAASDFVFAALCRLDGTPTTSSSIMGAYSATDDNGYYLAFNSSGYCTSDGIQALTVSVNHDGQGWVWVMFYRSGDYFELSTYTAEGAQLGVATGNDVNTLTEDDCFIYVGFDENVTMAVAYVWRVANDYMLNGAGSPIVPDPFSVLRQKLTPTFPAIAPSTVLYATGDGTIQSVVNELDTTTNLYQSVDDDPTTPTDSDFVNNRLGLGAGDATVFFQLTDMPGDFDQASAASITIRVRGQTWITGADSLYGRLYQSNESTALSDEVELREESSTTSFTNYTADFTGVVAGSKTIWDGARLRLRWSDT